MNAIERIMRHVSISDGCWVWVGSRDIDGYGNFNLDGMLWRAHRAMYTLVVDEIPFGMQVLHRCDNPSCVRPGHLWLGTNEDNVADKVQKGRVSSGEKHTASKLTQANVDTIRSDYAAGGYKIRHLADRYNVANSTISKILTGSTWK